MEADEIAEELQRFLEDKNIKDKDLFYEEMVKSMQLYAENLRNLHNQVVIMRLESVKAKLDYLQCLQELELISIMLETAAVLDMTDNAETNENQET